MLPDLMSIQEQLCALALKLQLQRHKPSVLPSEQAIDCPFCNLSDQDVHMLRVRALSLLCTQTNLMPTSHWPTASALHTTPSMPPARSKGLATVPCQSDTPVAPFSAGENTVESVAPRTLRAVSTLSSSSSSSLAVSNLYS